MLLTIEKLVYGGDGLARLPADEHGKGKAVFVPFVLPGESVEASLTEEHPGFSKATVQKITQPVSGRIPPGCRYFTKCGGCHYQQADYEHQLEIKAEILRENLRRLAKLELDVPIQKHPSPPWNYRNRARLAVRQRDGFVLGYRRFGSEEVLPVEECPIVSPLLQNGIAAIWALGRDGQVPEAVREIELFADAEDANLLVLIYEGDGLRPSGRVRAPAPTQAGRPRAAVPTRAMPPWELFAQQLAARLPAVETIALLGERDLAKLASGVGDEKPYLLHGPGFLTYNAAGHAYHVSAGSFFQANRYLIEKLVEIVTKDQSGETALDLYAGVGLFTLPLAAYFRRVLAVEASPLSHADLRYNLPANAKAVRATAEEYLAGTGAKLRADLIIVDPPRTGLGVKVARSLARLAAPCITYVSCDPATLARDLGPLFEAGYRVEQAHLVDLFPQTYHLETVLQLKR